MCPAATCSNTARRNEQTPSTESPGASPSLGVLFQFFKLTSLHFFELLPPHTGAA